MVLEPGTSLIFYHLMGPFIRTLLGLLVGFGFFGIQTESRFISWPCQSNKSMFWIRYSLQTLNLFVLLSMLVLDFKKEVFYGII